MAGDTVFKGVVLTALKFFIGFGLGLLLNMFFGPAGMLGLTPLAVIGAVTKLKRCYLCYTCITVW